MSRTLLAFHAHPDDEALLTGGSLAKAAAAGHRVVLVVATDGGLGMTSRRFPREELGRIRLEELRDSAAALGASRVEWLGYADSGLQGNGAGRSFVEVPVSEAAEQLAALLREEAVDVLLLSLIHI